MREKVYMIYNRKITDGRFDNISDLIIQKSGDLELVEITSEDTELGYWPKSMKLCNLVDGVNPTEVLDVIRPFVEQIEQEYNLICTICVYYPSDGYIGWHTNDNFQFYNAICSFSTDGKSFFEHIKDNESQKIYDDIGWYVKKTKWSKENSVPHRAVSSEHRITITFSSKNESDCDKFIEDITRVVNDI